MRTNRETERLLELLTSKADWVLNFVLRNMKQYEAEYFRLSIEHSDYSEFGLASRSLILNASKLGYFVQAISHRMPAEIGGLFWTSLTHELLDNERCHYQRFGSFTSRELGNRVRVDFSSDLDIAANRYESLEPQDDVSFLLSKAITLILRSAWESTIEIEQTHSDRTSRVNLLISEFLANVLEPTYSEVRRIILEEPQGINAKLSLFALLSRATSLAAYEAWTFAFASELMSRHEVIVPGVGSFVEVDGKIRFIASEMFLGILAANQLQKDSA